MSSRIRQQVGFCELCGATTDLTADHIIPRQEAPALMYNPANIRVLCRTHNSERGTNVTDSERNRVYAAVAARQAYLLTRGDAPKAAMAPRPLKAKLESETA